ncbi:MAG: CFI-box-CTERM domain-containing protein [Bdellovibrionales bacterium]
MSQKMYSEAAVSYEKYLKILEIVFGVEKGQSLTPEKFKDSARTEELTIVASVYWDLLRIYDTSDKYGERQQQAARQLATFIKFTPIFPDIIKRAESFVKKAKHPAAIKSFLKMASAERPRCFIASAAFESPLCSEVQILRWWRDSYLKKSTWGRKFILLYYRVSPRVAEILDNSKILRQLTRTLLRYLIKCVS